MSKVQTLVFMFGAMLVLGACAQKEQEVVYMEPEPITAEPAYTKY